MFSGKTILDDFKQFVMANLPNFWLLEKMRMLKIRQVHAMNIFSQLCEKTWNVSQDDLWKECIELFNGFTKMIIEIKTYVNITDLKKPHLIYVENEDGQKLKPLLSLYDIHKLADAFVSL
jgi:hypothetical protein